MIFLKKKYLHIMYTVFPKHILNSAELVCLSRLSSTSASSVRYTLGQVKQVSIAVRLLLLKLFAFKCQCFITLCYLLVNTLAFYITNTQVSLSEINFVYITLICPSLTLNGSQWLTFPKRCVCQLHFSNKTFATKTTTCNVVHDVLFTMLCKF